MMPSHIRIRKWAADYRLYAGQCILITLMIAVAVAGVVATQSARAVLAREISKSFEQAQVADLALVVTATTLALREKLATLDGIKDVDTRRSFYTRAQVSDGSWLPARVAVFADLNSQSLNRIHRHSSDKTFDNRLAYIEQSASALIDTGPGAPLRLRRRDGSVATLTSGGQMHDPGVAPSFQDRQLYIAISSEMATQLGYPTTLDQYLIKLNHRGPNAAAEAYGTTLKARLIGDGDAPIRVDTLPVQHPHQGLMRAMLAVFSALSGLIAICALALILNSVIGWMKRETRAIGILKAIGAKPLDLFIQYAATFFPLIIAALALGVTGGLFLSKQLVEFNAVGLNIDLINSRVPVSLLVVLTTALVVFIAAAIAVPVLRAVRLRTVDAINDTDSQIKPPTKVWRVFSSIPISVIPSLALRNLSRRPWRALAAIAALGVGGALLLTSYSTYESLIRVTERSLANQGHDLEVVLTDPASASTLSAIAMEVDGVEIAESWARARMRHISESHVADTPAAARDWFTLTGYSDNSALFKLPVVAGRPPNVTDSLAVLVTKRLQRSFPQFVVGATPLVQFRDKSTRVNVVGVVEEIAVPAMYASKSVFKQVTGLSEQAHAVRVKASGANLTEVAAALDQQFMHAGLVPSQIHSREVLRETIDEHIKVMTDVLSIMGIASALVGAIILVTTTLLNVTERRREVGVMRAIGAAPRMVAKVFFIESATIALGALVVAVAIAWPLTTLILGASETRLLDVSIPLHVSGEAIVLFAIGGALIIGTIALALTHALRRSVREALSYD